MQEFKDVLNIDFDKIIKERSKKEAYMERKEKEKKFVCRICGCRKYKPIFPDSSFIGGRIYAIHYACEGCSVLFADPNAFSKENP